MELRMVGRCLRQVWFMSSCCSLLRVRAHGSLTRAARCAAGTVSGIRHFPQSQGQHQCMSRMETLCQHSLHLCELLGLEGWWETVLLQEERASCILAAPTNRIFGIVTQPAFLERNTCNRKGVDHSPVSDGEGFRSLCDFFRLSSTRGKIPLV